ncbi:MAG: hypothetical protein LUF78_02065 [Clostridiales bacterium]|nr:hypothetical protein [Clostridiales bacterium]
MRSVNIFLADPRVLAGREEELLSRIAPCYAHKYEQSAQKKEKLQELASGLLLQKYLGVARDESLRYNRYGKPRLAAGKPYFSLSHSENRVALAISDCEVGLDVEKIMPFHEAVVKKVYTLGQAEELSALEGEERDARYTGIWTENEAVLKLEGGGFEEVWKKGSHILEKESLWNAWIYTHREGDYFLSCAAFESLRVSLEKADLLI